MSDLTSSNQRRTEPVPPTPAHGDPGVAEHASPETSAGAPYPAEPDRGSAGSAAGVPVPPAVPAAGTSEQSAPVPGVAQEAHADGETDVRVPPTTFF